MLQNEQIATLRIDDMQVEALLIGIQQSLKNAGDNELIKNLTSSLESLMLYALDLTNNKNVDYQQYIGMSGNSICFPIIWAYCTAVTRRKAEKSSPAR